MPDERPIYGQRIDRPDEPAPATPEPDPEPEPEPDRQTIKVDGQIVRLPDKAYLRKSAKEEFTAEEFREAARDIWENVQQVYLIPIRREVRRGARWIKGFLIGLTDDDDEDDLRHLKR